MKRFLKSKTMIFSSLIAVLAVLEMHADLVQQVVGPDKFGRVMLLIAVVSAVLRLYTTKPLSEK